MMFIFLTYLINKTGLTVTTDMYCQLVAVCFWIGCGRGWSCDSDTAQDCGGSLIEVQKQW